MLKRRENFERFYNPTISVKNQRHLKYNLGKVILHTYMKIIDEQIINTIKIW